MWKYLGLFMLGRQARSSQEDVKANFRVGSGKEQN
jgi:hypothetical protein